MKKSHSEQLEQPRLWSLAAWERAIGTHAAWIIRTPAAAEDRTIYFFRAVKPARCRLWSAPSSLPGTVFHSFSPAAWFSTARFRYRTLAGVFGVRVMQSRGSPGPRRSRAAVGRDSAWA